MVRSSVLLVALASCGRVAFDPSGDSGTNGDDGGGTMDARLPAVGPVQVVHTVSNSCSNCNSIALQVMAPTPDDPAYRRVALLVDAVGLGAGGMSPVGTTITYGNVPMNGAMRVVHPDPTIKPVLELWQLSDPPAGTSTVTLILDGTANTIVMGVILIDGVHPTQPIRTFGAGTGQGIASMTSATVNSSPDDVVVDMLCAGASIETQDPANTGLINQSLGNVSTCGNLQAGRRTGATPSVTSHWMVNGSSSDYWVELLASFQPP